MPTLFGYRVEPNFDPGEERKEDRLNWVIWGGFILLMVYGLFRTFSVEMFQAYLATGFCYGVNFYVKWRNHFRKLWLWKAIFASVPLYTLYLAGLFWSDRTFPDLMTKAIVFIPVLILGLGIESVLIRGIVNRLKPSSADQMEGPVTQT
jgi:hypothetical protein